MICHLFLSKFFVASEAPKSRNTVSVLGLFLIRLYLYLLSVLLTLWHLPLRITRRNGRKGLHILRSPAAGRPSSPGPQGRLPRSLPPAWNEASPNLTWPDSLMLSRAFWPWFICWWAARRLSPFLSNWFRDGSGTALYLFSWDYLYFIILPVGSHLGLYCLFEDGDIYSFSHRTPRCFLWGSQHPPCFFHWRSSKCSEQGQGLWCPAR